MKKGGWTMSIGSRISVRRKELKMSQEKLAEKIGVTFQAVSAWEREIYKPETENLKKIADALSTTVSWLLHEDEIPPRWEFHDEMYNIDNMYNQVKHYANALDFGQTLKALPLMEKYHKGQIRKGKDKVPYIVHPLLVACHALALGLKDDDLLAAALLHDVVEDCDVSAEELDVNEEIREIVRLVTFEQRCDESKHDAKVRYYKAIRENKRAIMVKILDRCNNVSHMAAAFTKQKMADYIDETEEFILPLIDLVKREYPEYYNAVFLLKYQMISVMESLKRMI